MAVFFTNVCKFKNCGIVFPTLYNLIEHIEEFHIDFNTKIYEEILSPYEFMPLSRILKYSSCRRVKNVSVYNQETKVSFKKKPPIHIAENYELLTKSAEDDDVLNVLDDKAKSMFNNSISSSSRSSSSSSSLSSNSPLDCYVDNFQKTNNYGMVDPKVIDSTNCKNKSKAATEKKPYSCTIPGCSKSYKHSNGIRYHIKFGHCSFNTKSKTKRKQTRFSESTTFNNNLKQNNFTSMCKPAGEFSLEMDARNRNISEHGYSTPYFNGSMLPPFVMKNRISYYV